jgi:hypothetical protein
VTTTPTTYPPVGVWGGWAKDTYQGAATPLTGTIGTTKPVTWNDKPIWLEDKSLRGDMTDGPFNTAQGVLLGEITFPESPIYIDSFGFPLGNIMGDLVCIGSSAPYANAFAELNSATGQGTAHTYEQYYGPTPTSGSRLFTGLVFTEVKIMWDVAKKWLTWSGKAACWASTPAASKPTNGQSSVLAIPSWRQIQGLGGPASGGTQVLTCKSGSVTLTREFSAEYAGSGTQNPYIMQRGSFNAKFDDVVYITGDESIYGYMINNSCPQLQVVFPNGLSGAAQGALQIDAQSASFRSSPADYSGKLITWKTGGVFQANSTNAGASGGASPLKITLTNAVASGTYV